MKKANYPNFLKFFDQKKFNVKNNLLISKARKINDSSKKIWENSRFINFESNEDEAELPIEKLFDDFDARLNGDLVALAYSIKCHCHLILNKKEALRNKEFIDVVDTYFRRGCEIINKNKEIFLNDHTIDAWHPFLRVIFLFQSHEVVDACQSTDIRRMASAFEKASLTSKKTIEDKALYLIQRESKLLTLRFDVVAENLTRYNCETSLMRSLNEINLQVAGGMLMTISAIFPRNYLDIKFLHGCIGHVCVFISLNKISGKEEDIISELMDGLNDLDNRKLSLKLIYKGEIDSVKRSFVGIKKFKLEELNREIDEFCEFMTVERSILKPLSIDLNDGSKKTINNLKIKTF
ncbi:hypothetical protein [Comamonas thiooxydans]|nr:hypothetical protein [Comamonas thiooxydans]